ncbi:MAG TPA: PKD domain-containing protein [Nocardioidaceae bacterium]|nr:PKD domain-containing protein [Nocardioidaceae bacterium]
MTAYPWSRRLTAASISLVLLSPFGLLASPALATAPTPGTTIATTVEPTAATASDFLFYMYPLSATGLPLCEGVGRNVTEPYYASDDCGFASFNLTGTATKVEAKAIFEDGTSVPLTVSGSDGSYDAALTPDAASWKPGLVRLVVSADGTPAGETTFGYNLLQATFDEVAPVRSGEKIPVTGTIVQRNSGPAGSEDAGVPAAFTLRVTDPSGKVLHSAAVTAKDDGTFAAEVPASVTSDLYATAETEFRTVLGLSAVGATFADGDDTWKAAEAGVGSATVVSDASTLQLHNSFVSSVGWVKPGESYPSRLTLTNATDRDFTGVAVRIPAPDGTSFTQARAGASAGSASVSGGSVTWTLGTVPKASGDSPTVRTLVLEAEADTLKEDPEVVWKNISSTATLVLNGRAQSVSSESRGPRVIPPGSQYDTARYGDRPFPVVPVDYRDRKHQASNSGDELSDVINSPEIPGSTFNLFQEISLGQLFPRGTVPSAGVASAPFAQGDEYDFTTLSPEGTCTGTTFGNDGVGTPLHPNRIEDGFYQLPGDTAYYGADKYGSAVAGAVAGVGTLMDIDSACGPTGKLVYDSAAIADPEIDYSDYDTDKDGVVDFFMVVYAGCGGHGASQLTIAGCAYPDAPYDNVWPHSSSLEFYYTDEETGLTGYVTDDQLENLEGQKMYYTDKTYSQMTTQQTAYPVYVRVGPYNVNPETSIDKASVISHEYGHSLGLPDFYSLGSRETYGDWNLMATDKSQNMDVFSRQEMGWVVPQVLKPGQRTTVKGWTHSKKDTHKIVWQRPDGKPYTLTGPKVHNAQAFVAKLPGRRLIDPAKFDSGDKASKSHAWWSGSGNDYGCPPQGGHNLDIALPKAKALPENSTIELTFKSLWDIEWDYDYGFVLTSGDNGESYTSHESKNGYTTPSSSNPNQNGCQSKFGNGITGTSGSYDAGSAQTDRLLGEYPDSVFLADAYDVSDLAGAEHPVLRFTYATDPGLARPGWFVDDISVVATTPDGKKIELLKTDMESSGDPDDPAFFNGGCKGLSGQALSTATQCTDGWNYVDASSDSPADHAYYMELRDRSGFDYEGKGQNDRDPITFKPGLSLVYTDEAHGYGNVGTDNPPAQSPLDANPEPGSDTPELADAAFTAKGKPRFSDAGNGHVDNYSDPTEEKPAGDVANPWRFDFDCLGFEITRMGGDDVDAPPSAGDLNADVVFDLGAGCGKFDYGYTKASVPKNTAPSAKASVRPRPARAGSPVRLSGRGTTDAQTPRELQYSWDLDLRRDSNGDKRAGNDKDAVGKDVRTTYRKPGLYTARLTVTDPDGAVDRQTVKVRVFRAVTCQSSKVRWSGSWRSRSGAGAGGKYCDNLGTRSGKDTLTLRFTGPRLTLAYGAAKRGGSAVVLVDGRRRGVVDFAGRTRRPRFARFRAWSGLGRGEHTVRLVMRRGAGYVDDFLISGVARRG